MTTPFSFRSSALLLTLTFAGFSDAATISQSTSMIPTAGSVSCNNGAANGSHHTDNAYSRAFDLSVFGISQPFSLTSVTFAVENANAGGVATSQPLDVRVYDGWSVAAGVLTPGPLLGTFSAAINDGTFFQQTVALSGTITSGGMVVELFTPNGFAAGHSMFMGSNGAGQSGPGYIAAADCGIPNRTDIALIGFPNLHLIMSVDGTAVPEPATLAFLGLGSLALVRRRRGN